MIFGAALCLLVSVAGLVGAGLGDTYLGYDSPLKPVCYMFGMLAGLSALALVVLLWLPLAILLAVGLGFGLLLVLVGLVRLATA